eukprot:scaffold5235_cov95-Isochrysis_galbana.AAC.4
MRSTAPSRTGESALALAASSSTESTRRFRVIKPPILPERALVGKGAPGFPPARRFRDAESRRHWRHVSGRGRVTRLVSVSLNLLIRGHAACVHLSRGWVHVEAAGSWVLGRNKWASTTMWVVDIRYQHNIVYFSLRRRLNGRLSVVCRLACLAGSRQLGHTQTDGGGSLMLDKDNDKDLAV